MLFHVSEKSGITEFMPRQSKYTQAPVVWAVDDEKVRNYLVPRDCPRVTYYAEPTPFRRTRRGFSERVQLSSPSKRVGGIGFAPSRCTATTCRRTRSNALTSARDTSLAARPCGRCKSRSSRTRLRPCWSEASSSGSCQRSTRCGIRSSRPLSSSRSFGCAVQTRPVTRTPWSTADRER